jgi:RND family efflux transporter MFP subunit
MATDVDLRELAIDRDEPATSGRTRTRHVFSRYVLPACLFLAFLLMLAWALRDVLLPATPVTVVPVHVSRAEIQQAGTPLFKAAGWIEPRPTPIAIAALAPGVVDQLLVVEDQAVKKDEPVAILVAEDAQLARDAAEADRKLRRAELEQAKATLAAARIRVDQPVHLEAQSAEAEAKLAAAQTRLADLPYQKQSAEARLRFAKTDYEGKNRAGAAVSGRALDQAKSELDAAQALVDQLARQETSLRAEVAALASRRAALQTQLELKTDEQQMLDEAKAKVDAAAARLNQAEVAVAETQLQLDRMTVRAPVDGRVYRLWSNPGARLVPGMGHDDGHDGSTVVSMYDPEQLQVRVDVRFDDLPQVRQGQPVIIESPAIAEPIEGEVLFLSAEADIQKNTLEVKVSITSPPSVFKPEMLVDVTFLAPQQPEQQRASHDQERVFVAKQLLRQGENGTFVWVADQTAGVARRTPITTGRRGTSELIEVTDGLNVSSRVIAWPQEGLRDGLRIRITQEDGSVGVETRSNPTQQQQEP